MSHMHVGNDPARRSAKASARADASARTGYKFPKLLLATLLITVVIASAAIFHFQSAQIRGDIEKELMFIADSKADRIASWMRERHSDAYMIKYNRFLAEVARDWLESGARAGSAASMVEAYMSELITAYGYEAVILFDLQSEPRLGLGTLAAISAEDKKTAAFAARSEQIQIQNIDAAKMRSGQENFIDLFVPLLAVEEGRLKPAAVILLRSGTTALFPMIADWPVPSATAEAVLVQREGDEVAFLSPLRNPARAPLNRKLPLTDPLLPAARAVQGIAGVMEGVDYRGVPVVAATRGISGFPWQLVAKIDITEAHAPIRALALEIAILATLATLSLVIAFLAWWRSQMAREAKSKMQQEIERLALIKHFDFLAKYANDIILLADQQGRVIEVNDQACALSGYTHDELLRMNVRDFVSGDTQPILERNLTDLPPAGAVFELRTRRKDGSTAPVEVSARRIEVEGKVYLQGIIRDITERKQAEDALRENAAILERVFATTHFCVAYLDRDFNFIRVNRAYADSCRQPPEYFRGKNHFSLYPHPENEAIFRKVVQTGEVFTITAKPFHFPGEPERGVTYWDWTLYPLKDAAGDVEALLFILLDVTERKRAESTVIRINRTLHALSSCNSALIHATSEATLFKQMCEIIVGIGGYRLAWVGIAENDAGKTVRPVAYAGYEEGYIDRARITWADTELGRGPTGRAIRTRAPQVCRDVHTDPMFAPWRENAIKLGYRSTIALPLVVGKVVLGALTIYAPDVDVFDPEEIQLLAELADDLAFGVDVLRTRAAHDRSAERLSRNMEETIAAIAATVEMRDPYTAGHQRRVSDLAAAIAQEMKLPEQQIHGLRLACVVHDLGKLIVPAEILSKPSRLSEAEFMLIRAHPQAAYDILKGIDFPWPIAQIVVQHHERLDGSGYPRALKGEAILVEARILAVSDTIEAMSSHRPYRPGLGIDAALKEIEQNRGRLYDEQAVDACVRLFREKSFAFSR